MADVHLNIIIFLLAVIIDLIIGEYPSRIHPTVWIGKTVSLAEKLAPSGRAFPFIYGIFLALCIPSWWWSITYLVGAISQNASSVLYVLIGAMLFKSTFSIRMLFQVARRMAKLVESNSIGEVRTGLRALVSRDVRELSLEEATAATVESVSENFTDSIVAPMMAFVLFGLPGAFAYRAINTLDSMIGYHGRYEYLGKASARFDDVVNWVPSRVTAILLVIGSSFLPGQKVSNAWRIMWRDHSVTESPNAGWTMSAMAGALGISLIKVGFYRLGDPSKDIQPQDIKRTLQSMVFVVSACVTLASLLLLLKARVFYSLW